MKFARHFLLTFFAVVVVGATSQGQVVFENSDGNFSSTGNTSGTLTLSNSELIDVTGLTAYGIPATPGDLGTVSFTTGAISTGSITAGATFSGAGSSFTIKYENGTIFTGSFANGATWTLIGGTYYFVGQVNGTLTVPGYNPATVMGATIDLTATGVTCTAHGCTATDGGGSTTFEHVPTLTPISPVPEPGTLTLLGSGLVGLGLFARRKWLKLPDDSK